MHREEIDSHIPNRIFLANIRERIYPQQGYSFEPLNNPIFGYAEVLVGATVFNNWLVANYSRLNAKTMKLPREHIYYLLSSYVSEIYKRDKVILPKGHDVILEMLFSWSERLGVYGGSLVYNRIKKEGRKPMPVFMKIPDSFSLSLDNDLYHLEAKPNVWSVKFPYYFMVYHMHDFQAANGMKTKFVVISTGATIDNTKAGRSQGTLSLIFSPSNDFDLFSKSWLDAFSIPLKTKVNKLGVKNMESRSTFDKDSLMHREIAFISSKNGSYAVAYLGMDGTYQSNRQHFLDFLHQLQIPGEATANKSLNQNAQ